MLRLSNTAKSFSEIAPQASIFVPVSLPSARLPDYVNIDVNSEWHRSALLLTAWESMTLPSRLRSHQTGRETYDQLESALNINGKQNIAKLRMAVNQQEEINGDNESRLEIGTFSGDQRLPSQDRRSNGFDSDKEPDEAASFDIDFFVADSGEQARGRRFSKNTHTFGQAENLRTEQSHQQNKDKEVEDVGYERARRRAAGLTITRRLVLHSGPNSTTCIPPECQYFHVDVLVPRVPGIRQVILNPILGIIAVCMMTKYLCRTNIPLLFPVLDSFPNIFTRSDVTMPLSVNTSLSTDTSVALRLKSMRQIVGRAVGLEDREALSNSLDEMAEAYEEGWDSGSDDEDD